MKRSVIILTLISFIAMGAGFFREVVTAYFFGTSAASDAFSITLFYIDGITTVVLLGLAGYMIVPIVTRLEKEDGFHLLQVLVQWLTLLGILCVIFGILFPQKISGLIAPDFSARQRGYLEELIQWGTPSAIVILVSGLIAGVLQAHEDYYSPAFGRAVFSLGVALPLLLGSQQWGILAGGIGLFVGSVGQFLWIFIGLLRLGWRPVRPRWWHASMPSALAMGLPALLALVLINILMGGAQRWLASGLPEGSFAAINYAQRAIGLVTSFSLALATVSLTDLSLRYNENKSEESSRSILKTSLEGGVFLVTPLSVLFFLLSQPLIAVLFQRGQYTEESMWLTIFCLRWFLLSVIPGMVVAVLHRACAAFHQPWWAVVISAVWTAATLLFTIVFLGVWGATAVPAGYAIGTLFAAFTGFFILRRFIGSEVMIAVAAYFFRIVFRSALALAMGWGVYLLLLEWNPSSWQFSMNVLGIGLVGAVFMSVFSFGSIMARDAQIMNLWNLIKLRWKYFVRPT
jgi:putative peptidoglycan lipid II flippase